MRMSRRTAAGTREEAKPLRHTARGKQTNNNILAAHLLLYICMAKITGKKKYIYIYRNSVHQLSGTWCNNLLYFLCQGPIGSQTCVGQHGLTTSKSMCPWLWSIVV